MTLVSLKRNRQRKYDIFTVIGILFSVKLSDNARLFSSASCICNDSNLCESSIILGQLVCNHCFLLFFFIRWLSCHLSLTHVEMLFLGTPYLWATSLFERLFSRFLKVRHFLPKLFKPWRIISPCLHWVPKQCWKKERTNFRTKFCQCSY